MSWWIWLLLVLFMVVMLVAGAAYVFTRGVVLMHVVSSWGSMISDRFDQSEVQEPDAPDDKPIFTEPLQVASSRYATAHSQVLARRQNARRRHMARWKQWSRFNS